VIDDSNHAPELTDNSEPATILLVDDSCDPIVQSAAVEIPSSTKIMLLTVNEFPSVSRSDTLHEESITVDPSIDMLDPKPASLSTRRLWSALPQPSKW
jgi:hypothetical protein